GDLAARDLEDGRQAGEDGLAIDEDGAGATVAFVASLLGAGQAENVPERLQERVVHRDAGLVPVAVDVELDDRVHGRNRRGDERDERARGPCGRVGPSWPGSRAGPTGAP